MKHTLGVIIGVSIAAVLLSACSLAATPTKESELKNTSGVQTPFQQSIQKLLLWWPRCLNVSRQRVARGLAGVMEFWAKAKTYLANS